MKKKRKNITVKDIAIALNVSAPTVSRALKNSHEISKKTKELIWEKAREMGYLPNIPVYMQKQKSKIILFLIDRLNDLSIEEIIGSAQNLLVERTFSPVIRFLNAGTGIKSDFTNILNNLDVSGVISLLEDNSLYKPLHQKIKTLGIPLITVNHSNSDLPDVNVIPDIYNGSFLATAHLLKRGAGNIILFTDTKGTLQKDMENGIRAAMISFPDSQLKIIESENDPRILKYEFEQYLKFLKPTDGIITSNRNIARQLYNFLNSKNIDISKDVMLISFGNETINDISSSKISAVEFSAGHMGLHAAEQMLNLIEKKEIENKISIEPVKLIIRSSSMKLK